MYMLGTDIDDDVLIARKGRGREIFLLSIRGFSIVFKDGARSLCTQRLDLSA